MRIPEEHQSIGHRPARNRHEDSLDSICVGCYLKILPKRFLPPLGQTRCASALMLKDTINNSISSKARHLGEAQVAALFYKHEPLDPLERYAVSIIFSEATLQEIFLFLRKHAIPFANARALYRSFSHRERGPTIKERSNKYEWFFE